MSDHSGMSAHPIKGQVERALRRGERPASVDSRAVPSDLKFHCAGRALSHKVHVKPSSHTMLRSPQLGQRRKMIRLVKPAGRDGPTRSRASATAGQQSGSWQYLVDWFVTSATRQPVPATANAISPAPRTSAPPAKTTCSLRRGTSLSTPPSAIPAIVLGQGRCGRCEQVDGLLDADRLPAGTTATAATYDGPG
jgi:hypothetical protein